MTNPKFKIRKGDQVLILTGKDKGRTGEVLEVRPSEARVKVQGINMVSRHRRPTQTSPGGIDKMEALLHISNVSLIDPDSASDAPRPTRVGFSVEGETKTRIARKSGKAF